MFKPRTYRRWVKNDGLVFFEVIEKETDLAIYATKSLPAQARASILTCRAGLEEHIAKHPGFLSALEPIDSAADAPTVVRKMYEAGRKAGVGPMAAVAGAIAEFVGRDLLHFSDEVIVENGGDIFLKTKAGKTLGVYAGDDSPFTGKLAIEILPAEDGIGVCTSSGTVSHSLSFGKSDAVVIISEDAAVADAAATATANRVKAPRDIEDAIGFARSVEGVRGALVIIGDKMGSWGEMRLI